MGGGGGGEGGRDNRHAIPTHTHSYISRALPPLPDERCPPLFSHPSTRTHTHIVLPCLLLFRLALLSWLAGWCVRALNRYDTEKRELKTVTLTYLTHLIYYISTFPTVEFKHNTRIISFELVSLHLCCSIFCNKGREPFSVANKQMHQKNPIFIMSIY